MLPAAVLAAWAIAQDMRYNIVAVGASAPDTAVAGQTMAISATFRSDSSAPPPAFHWAAYLTTATTTVDAQAIALGTFGPVALGAGEMRSVAQTVTLPPGTAGLYFVTVAANSDGAVMEYDPFDDVASVPHRTRVRLMAPDVSVDQVAGQEARLKSGQTLHVTFTLRNTGETAATVPVDAYVSPHPTVSTTDPLIGTTSLDVPAGGAASGAIMGPIPSGLATGDYAVGIVVDPDNTVAEVSRTSAYGVAPNPVDIFADTLSFDTATLPEGAVGIDYYARLSASGGDGHFQFTLTSGTLPAGLMLDSAEGIVQGTPSASGTSSIAVQVASDQRTASRNFSILIHPTGAKLTIVDRQIENGALGHAYQQILVAAGGEPPYTWSLKSGFMLPPGLVLAPNGIISGTPSMLGAYVFDVVVADRLGATDGVEYSMSVAPPVNVIVLPQSPPAVTVGQLLDYRLQATGGVPPYTWALISTPPPGINLAPDGRLSGMTIRVGKFPIRVRATDSTRVKNSDTNLVQVVVNDDGTLRVKTSTLPPVTTRTRYETTIAASGGTPPLTWSLVPGDMLPGGFYLVPGDGKTHPTDEAVIYGTTVHTGEKAFTVRVEDAFGRRADKLFFLSIGQVAAMNSGGGCTCHIEQEKASGAGSWLSAWWLLALFSRWALRRHD